MKKQEVRFLQVTKGVKLLKNKGKSKKTDQKNRTSRKNEKEKV